MSLSIDNCGKLRLIILIWILTLTLYNIADSQTLAITSTRTKWENLKTNCNAVSDVSNLFCSEIKDIYKCHVTPIYSMDTSNFLDDFSAWIHAYLVRSFSIVYKGCYPHSNGLDHIDCNATDLISCARLCDNPKHTKLGIEVNNSYCISDNELVIDDPHAISEDSCHSENSENALKMKVYDIKKHVILDKDLCPVGYSLGTSNVFVGEEDCQTYKKFYCYGSTAIERNAMSWYDAQKLCKDISSRLLNEGELSSSTKGQYWLHGLHYNDFDIQKPLPLYPTRCAAIHRHRKVYSIKLFDCSIKLYTLCISKHAPTNKWPGISISPTPSSSTKMTSTKLSPTSPGVTFQITAIFSTDVNISTTTTNNSVTMATLIPDTVSVSIIIPVLAIISVLAIIGVVIFCIRRRQNAGNNLSLSPQREHTTLLDAQKSGQSSPNTDAGAESVELQSH
ncbi:uncharacterized protein LOC143063477 isoform X1 [Mytilus galloprovincialis]|uniref:uncharacterized protein LOC143063477 isoform X1 n=1 Tax=Mytilus galloprovincialis TaxID=29158 RepID=UPI003F7B82B5